MTYDHNLPLVPFCNPTTVGFPRSPFASDSRSDPYYAAIGQRRPSPSKAPHLRNEKLRCDRNLGWSIDFATAFLAKHLDPATSPDAACDFKRLRNEAQRRFNEGRQQDLPYTCFNRLDRILFAGHLRGAVFLGVRDFNAEVSGITYSHGHYRERKHPVHRIAIILNLSVLRRVRVGGILAILIHHMIHAYFLVACGSEDEREVGYGRLAHGPHFAKIENTIRSLSGTGARPLSFDFARLQTHYPYYDEYYEPQRPRRPSKWFCSHCHFDTIDISDDEIAEYYDVACAPLLDLPEPCQKADVFVYNERHHRLDQVHRASDLATPSVDSVEFIFEDQPVQVPREYINNFLTVLRAFQRAKTRYLPIPEETSKDTFLTLLELLHTDHYTPDIRPVTIVGQNGPPVIHAVQEDSKPYLLTSIRLFKLAAELNLDDIKAIALNRLKAQCTTAEDPMTVLRELYSGGEPDPELRIWSREFLQRAPDMERLGPGVVRAGGAAAATASSPEPPNLVKLMRDMCFRERFYDLVPRFGALESDVHKVEQCLLREGVMVGSGREGSWFSGGGAGGGGGNGADQGLLGMNMGLLGVPLQAQIAGPPQMTLGMGPPMGRPMGMGVPMSRLMPGPDELERMYDDLRAERMGAFYDAGGRYEGDMGDRRWMY